MAIQIVCEKKASQMIEGSSITCNKIPVKEFASRLISLNGETTASTKWWASPAGFDLSVTEDTGGNLAVTVGNTVAAFSDDVEGIVDWAAFQCSLSTRHSYFCHGRYRDVEISHTASFPT